MEKLQLNLRLYGSDEQQPATTLLINIICRAMDMFLAVKMMMLANTVTLPHVVHMYYGKNHSMQINDIFKRMDQEHS